MINYLISIIMFSDLFASYTPVESILKDVSEDNIEQLFNNDEILSTPLMIIDDTLDLSLIDSPSFDIPSFEEDFDQTFNFDTKKVYKGSDKFEQAFEEAVKINPEVVKYKEFLVRTAKRESGFNSYIQNTTGAPYYGYFQMGKREIKATTGLSVEEFRKDPVKQILGAVNLYKMNLRSIKALSVYEIGKQKGYSDDALVSGAWLAGPGGVKKFLLKKGDPSDSHWYKNGKGGTSVSKIMNNWMKE